MGYSRADLLDMGLDASAINKAEKHFGNSISNEAAVDWIFSGCPGATEDMSKAVVHVPQPKSGWDEDESPKPSNREWEGVGALAALQHGGSASFNTAQEQWAGYVPGSHNLQPGLTPDESEDDELKNRGRAGRPSPVTGTLPKGAPKGTADNPVMLGDTDHSMPDETDDIHKAIQLSLDDNSRRTRSVSRGDATASKSREEREKEDLDRALSMSLADLREQASPTPQEYSMEGIDSSGSTAQRASLDTPMSLQAPSPFLSHLPSLLLSFFHNIPFRMAVLELHFAYAEQPDSADYGMASSKSTRQLLLLHGEHTPICTLRMASLQRLFAHMEKSLNATVGLKDIVDSFDITIPSSPSRSPIQDDLVALQEKITAALLEYHTMIFTQAGVQDSDQAIKAKARLEAIRKIVMFHGINVGSTDLQILESDHALSELYNEDNVAWLDHVDLDTWFPDCYDTYSALDNRMATRSDLSFLLQPSDSLYMHIRRLPKPSINGAFVPYIGTYVPQVGSEAETLDDIKTPFQIAPEIFLDRYQWSNRKRIVQLREATIERKAQLMKLEAKKNKLLRMKNSNKLIFDGENRDGKGALDRAAKYLETAETTTDSASVSARLFKRLATVIELLKQEVTSLTEQTNLLRKEDTQCWNEDLPKDHGPYRISTVCMWTGLPGKQSFYCYVRSGWRDAEGTRVARWWKIKHDEVVEVDETDALTDGTGVFMPEGGSILHMYVSKSAEAKALQKTSAPTVQDSTALEAPSSFTPGASDTSALHEAIITTGDQDDIAMSSESQQPQNISETTLRLSGGSSRPRRSSISSDTGSIASTSKVRIGDEFSDDEAGEDAEETVELGFAVKMKKGFKVVKDVGKIGGKPTWLNPSLPLEPGMVVCQICSQRMEFLMQINAPLDDMPQAIYRTLYIYTCRKASCLSKQHLGSVKVYRSQLPEKNDFYEVADPNDQLVLQRFRDKQYASLCSDCKMVRVSEQSCLAEPWTEWLIESGPEEIYDDEPATENDIETTMRSATLSDEDATEDINEPDTKPSVDAAFLKFQERLHNEPDQVIRYYYRDVEKRADPLWVSDIGKATATTIPRCHCGSTRSCELQIMSTILSYIGVDDMEKDSFDFGTIAIYTCDASCSTTPAPAFTRPEEEFQRFAPAYGWEEEVAYVQNYSSRGVEFR